MSGEPALLELDGLAVHFPITRGLLQRQVSAVRAVEGVTLSLRRGEAFGLVGESGCGKSTLARAVLRLEEPTAGSIRFDGTEITALDGRGLAPFRKRIGAIFQDPFSSLNPRQKAGKILEEVLSVHDFEGDRRSRMLELLDICGLEARFAELYPHQMSGGQRQRVGIARALALEPELVVCDEAVSSLDVSIQAQVINLLAELRERFGLTYLFIAHDLSVVRHLCDRVAVMYLGRIVEEGPSEILFADPRHPYTKALIDAIPRADPEVEAGQEGRTLPGEVPSPSNPPSGCVFHTRCPIAMDKCRRDEPPLESFDTERRAACFASHEQVRQDNTPPEATT